MILWAVLTLVVFLACVASPYGMQWIEAMADSEGMSRDAMILLYLVSIAIMDAPIAMALHYAKAGR